MQSNAGGQSQRALCGIGQAIVEVSQLIDGEAFVEIDADRDVVPLGCRLL